MGIQRAVFVIFKNKGYYWKFACRKGLHLERENDAEEIERR